MRGLLLLLIAGCGSGDPCDSFSGQTCIAFEIHGPMVVDQVRVQLFDSLQQLALDGRSPPAPLASPTSLPVQVAALPPTLAGQFFFVVEGLIAGGIVGGFADTGAIAAGSHLHLSVTLTPPNVGVDLSSSARDLSQTTNCLQIGGACITGMPCCSGLVCNSQSGTCLPCGGGGSTCGQNGDCCTSAGLACNGSSCATCVGNGADCSTAPCCDPLACIQDSVTFNFNCGPCRQLGEACVNARACCEPLVCGASGCRN